MPLQVRQTRLGPSATRIRVIPGSGYFPAAGDEIASILGALPSEPEGEIVRGGGLEVSFDPPRLRTIYEISNINIVFPPLQLFLETAASKVSGNFGYIVSLRVNNVLVLSELVPPESYSAGEKEKIDPIMQSRQLQISLPQSIVLSRNDAIALEVGAFMTVTKASVKAELAVIELVPARTGASSVLTANLLYSQSQRKGQGVR
jgi:hypothetical protein